MSSKEHKSVVVNPHANYLTWDKLTPGLSIYMVSACPQGQLSRHIQSGLALPSDFYLDMASQLLIMCALACFVLY